MTQPVITLPSWGLTLALFALGAAASASPVGAPDQVGVAVYGTNLETGIPVLMAYAVPQPGGPTPTAPAAAILARGGTAPAQGPDSTIAWWKTGVDVGEIWQYDRGVYRRLVRENPEEPYPVCEAGIPSGSPAFLAMVGSRISEKTGLSVREVELLPRGDVYYGEAGLVFPLPSDDGWGREPVGWIDASHLIYRKTLSDKLGRLQASRLYVCPVGPAAPERTEGDPLFQHSSADEIDLAAAVFGGRAAVEVYDPKSEAFRIGVVDGHSGQVAWVLTPTTELGRQRSVTVLQLAWSPSGRYLAVATRRDGLRVWDRQSGQWLSHNHQRALAYGYQGLCWLDDDRVATFEYHQGMSTISICCLSDWGEREVRFPTLDKFRADGLFRVALPSK